jgi:hypothetical protein
MYLYYKQKLNFALLTFLIFNLYFQLVLNFLAQNKIYYRQIKKNRRCFFIHRFFPRKSLEFINGFNYVYLKKETFSQIRINYFSVANLNISDFNLKINHFLSHWNSP